jgi:hypothetical protein
MILQYYSAKGKLTVFDGYTIDNHGVVTNITTGRVMAQRITADGYAVVSVTHDGKRRFIRVARALASTFIGPPPTNHHTADHIDRDRSNDTLENIRWASTSGQIKNQTRPSDYKAAFIIVKDGVECTAKEWADVYTKLYGTRCDKKTIFEFAQQQQHGFGYKIFEDLPGEEWKAVPESKNSQGEWFISSMNRMKYKTKYAKNVLTVDQLHKANGYPTVYINGKRRYCHHLSMMTFRPEEYAAKLPGDIILHENDDKLDFHPFRLRWGTPSENGTDAHDNGRYDGATSARKSIVSYIDGVFEREYESIRAAKKYLQENGYPKADRSGVRYALCGAIRYGRTWKLSDCME